MRVWRWIPWQTIVTRMARANGFLDPLQFLSRLRRFSKPSEVSEPIELLRAGVIFHARGLVNTKAIQTNLDWIWPYWVEKQFNPADESFIPRAFSFSHINLTHRNWTAVGVPDVPYYPIVDPRGLVTPLYDGWSLDFWIVTPEGNLIPSKLPHVSQSLGVHKQVSVVTKCETGNLSLASEVALRIVDHHPQCVIDVRADAPAGSKVAVVLRPYNPEGISFIDSIALAEDRQSWSVNQIHRVIFDWAPETCLMSSYGAGDVAHKLQSDEEINSITCAVSMASAAAIYPIDSFRDRALQITVPIFDEIKTRTSPSFANVPSLHDEMAKASELTVPDPKVQELFRQAVATMVLHAPSEVFPGPYTYKRFWFRDAAFILNGLVTLGLTDRTRRALNRFPALQTHDGYFLSQQGEWDSNGEAIWIMHRYLKLAGESVPPEWIEPIKNGARWIQRKRLPRNIQEVHAGLLPAGFSAEHLGPNDYYYWDDFWGVAGLRCAAELLRDTHPKESAEFSHEADEFLATIQESFRHIPDWEARGGAISASPHRRMDAGAVGSLVADYPLQLFSEGDPRMLKSVAFLMEHSFFGGGFFQNMIHSGINAYLTLHVAQVLLRAGDLRALELIDSVADLATPTGQWPEAIHPRTRGGCMGDGQHVWAAAEWALMIRNLFVREEGPRLVIGCGLFPRWLDRGQPLALKNTLTQFGNISVALFPERQKKFSLHLEGNWRGAAPRIDVRVPGYIVTHRRANTVYSLEPRI